MQIIEGQLTGATVPAPEPTVGSEVCCIGRHTERNHIVIPEMGISRDHAEVGWCDDVQGFDPSAGLGCYCLRDLGSTTGTFVQVAPHRKFELFSGLLVKIGESEFQVICEPDNLQLLFFEGPCTPTSK